MQAKPYSSIAVAAAQLKLDKKSTEWRDLEAVQLFFAMTQNAKEDSMFSRTVMTACASGDYTLVGSQLRQIIAGQSVLALTKVPYDDDFKASVLSLTRILTPSVPNPATGTLVVRAAGTVVVRAAPGPLVVRTPVPPRPVAPSTSCWWWLKCLLAAVVAVVAAMILVHVSADLVEGFNKSYAQHYNAAPAAVCPSQDQIEAALTEVRSKNRAFEEKMAQAKADETAELELIKATIKSQAAAAEQARAEQFAAAEQARAEQFVKDEAAHTAKHAAAEQARVQAQAHILAQVAAQEKQFRTNLVASDNMLSKTATTTLQIETKLEAVQAKATTLEGRFQGLADKADALDVRIVDAQEIIQVAREAVHDLFRKILVLIDMCDSVITKDGQLTFPAFVFVTGMVVVSATGFVLAYRTLWRFYTARTSQQLVTATKDLKELGETWCAVITMAMHLAVGCAFCLVIYLTLQGCYHVWMLVDAALFAPIRRTTAAAKAVDAAADAMFNETVAQISALKNRSMSVLNATMNATGEDWKRLTNGLGF